MGVREIGEEAVQRIGNGVSLIADLVAVDIVGRRSGSADKHELVPLAAVGSGIEVEDSAVLLVILGGVAAARKNTRTERLLVLDVDGDVGRRVRRSVARTEGHRRELEQTRIISRAAADTVLHRELETAAAVFTEKLRQL